jgi:hypothetical protein
MNYRFLIFFSLLPASFITDASANSLVNFTLPSGVAVEIDELVSVLICPRPMLKTLRCRFKARPIR